MRHAAVGSFVELKARLLPPMSPSRPGSYDFGRDMYFQRIGASGFVMGSIKAAEPPDSGGLALRYSAVMQGLRDAIDKRIGNVLEGDRRAIATALLTGRRDAQVLDVLAVAYAAAGRFDDAVATAREAQAKAAPALARDIARRLALFERREAFVDKR